MPLLGSDELLYDNSLRTTFIPAPGYISIVKEYSLKVKNEIQLIHNTTIRDSKCSYSTKSIDLDSPEGLCNCNVSSLLPSMILVTLRLLVISSVYIFKQL